jgi:transcriptional regulator with XRE-family HTH domain
MKEVGPADLADLNRRFGEAVRAQRVRAGITQAALAQAIGLERTSVTNIESGIQTVTVPTLVKLCRALRVSPAVLLPLDSKTDELTLASATGRYASMAREILQSSLSGSR